MGLLKNKNISQLLMDKEVEYGIKEYILIQKEFNENKKIADNITFRSVFQAFYRLEERPIYLKFSNKDKFYNAFDSLKEIKEIDFKKCLDKISDVSKNCEKVFASKVLHTIDNKYPIMDSIVAKYFGINTSLSYGKLEKNKEKYEKLYEKYNLEYNNYLQNDPEAKDIIKEYNRLYPDLKISDVKIIDFALWADGKNSK